MPVGPGGQRLHLADGVVGFHRDRRPGPRTEHQVGFHIQCAQYFQQADADRGSGRSGHPDNQSHQGLLVSRAVHDQNSFSNRRNTSS
jgi:hypothetical protein